jgi:glutamine synthetase
MIDVEDVAACSEEFFRRHGVHTIESAFPDSWGALRGKRIPASQFRGIAESGFAISRAAFTWDLLCGIFPTDYANLDTGYPDMIAIPDPATLRRLTWRDGTAFVMCDCVELHGSDPIPVDPRHVLRTAERRLAALGYTATVATELEFYLCDESWTPLYSDIQCYSISKGAELEHIVSDIRRCVEEYGIVVEACNTEYGPAQIEINLGHGAPTQVADNTALFKYAVKEIARRHGARATFMSKPFMGYSGNGAHLHVSLRDKSERNAFATDDLDDGFIRNALMRRCVAGLLEHQREIAGIASPTINAYRRFEDNSFAPTFVNWGGDNRGVAVRCITGRGPATRIEIRTGSADANPHLLIAAQLAAICDGLEVTYELPPMCNGNGYASQERPSMPRSLEQAVEAMRGGRLLRTTFGDIFVDNLISLLKHEVEEFGKQVTDWEKSRYMEVS